MRAKNSDAEMPSTPRHALRQRPQLDAFAASELEIDELMDLSLANLQQQRQQAEAQQAGQQRSRLAGQERNDVLACRQQDRQQWKDEDRQHVPSPLKAGRDGKSLKDVPRGIQGARAEDHAG